MIVFDWLTCMEDDRLRHLRRCVLLTVAYAEFDMSIEGELVSILIVGLLASAYEPRLALRGEIGEARVRVWIVG